MDRKKIIRDLETKKRMTEYRLTNGDKYKSSDHLLRDFSKLCKLEKELEIQNSYLGQDE